MSDVARHRRTGPQLASATAAGGPARSQTALDARSPLRLDGAEIVLHLTAGVADIFAQPRLDGRSDGPRTHLFRVEPGNLIIGLPPGDADGAAREIGVFAVGGQGTEATILTPADIVDPALLDVWLIQLIGALGGASAGDGAIRGDVLEGGTGPGLRVAEAGARIDLVPGQRVTASAHGVSWIAVERGEIRLVDAEEPWTPEDGLLPLAAGSWIEAPGEATVAIYATESIPIHGLWPAIDRFHGLAIQRLRRRLVLAAESEAGRLDQRVARAEVHADQLFGELADIIAAGGRNRRAGGRDSTDPLRAACRIVGNSIGITLATGPARRSHRHDLAQVREIARSSRVRVRRTLLRADWWRRNAGPLVAWYGEERRPVAMIPVSPRSYVMVDPETGERQTVTEAVANGLAPEAATFYRPLPFTPLTVAGLLRWCARETRSDAWRILGAAMTLAVIALASPVIMAVLVDEVIPRSDLGQLAFCSAALVMAAFGTAGFQAVQGVATLRLSGTLDWVLQAAVIDRLLRLPVGFFRNYTAGDLADRVLGVEAIRQVITGRALSGILAGVFCLFSFALMFYYDLPLALVAALLTIIHGAVIVLVTTSRLRHERLHFDLQGKVQGLVLQFLTGIGKLRVAAATMRALAIWSHAFSLQKSHFIASQRAANRLIAFEAAFPTVASLIIFALARGGNGGAGLDTGQFLAFFAAFGQTLAAVAALGTAIGETVIAVPYYTRMQPILAAPPEVSEHREAPGEISGAVELSQVTFCYDPAVPILDRLSFQVDKGEYVALVGPSGSGKSTIFRLILGFEQPQSGTILYDGRAIDTLDIAAVRRQIGVVLQNGKLTSGSIYENICGAVPVPIEDAWEAARNAGLDADIEAMPMGMHTVINEGMSTLSGGQRQRLMIARALVHRPRMLLFDEATSALDNRTQSIVSESLGRLNVTRIVIAHRLSTVQDADRIIVLANGAVAQQGTFQELASTPGLFAELAKRQLA